MGQKSAEIYDFIIKRYSKNWKKVRHCVLSVKRRAETVAYKVLGRVRRGGATLGATPSLPHLVRLVVALPPPAYLISGWSRGGGRGVNPPQILICFLVSWKLFGPVFSRTLPSPPLQEFLDSHLGVQANTGYYTSSVVCHMIVGHNIIHIYLRG